MSRGRPMGTSSRAHIWLHLHFCCLVRASANGIIVGSPPWMKFRRRRQRCNQHACAPFVLPQLFHRWRYSDIQDPCSQRSTLVVLPSRMHARIENAPSRIWQQKDPTVLKPKPCTQAG